MLDDLILEDAFVRGKGPYIGKRGGSRFRGNGIDIGSDFDVRGAGPWAEAFKNMMRSAWSNIKKVILPLAKQGGVELTQALARKASEKAQDYVNKSEALGPAKGLITQALLDLPQVVTDVVSAQLNQRMRVLDDEGRKTLQEQGLRGGLAENLEFYTQDMMTTARPVIESAIGDLFNKYRTIEQYTDVVRGGGTSRDAHALTQNVARQKMMRKDKIFGEDDVAKKYFADLVENLCQSALYYAEQMDYIKPGSRTRQFLNGCNTMVMALNSDPGVQHLVTERKRMMPFQKTELCQGMCLLGDADTDIDVARGGALPWGLIAQTVLPGLASLVPSIIDAFKSWRGSGEDMDDDELQDLITAVIAGRGQGLKRSSSCRAICPPPKRRR